MGIYCRTDKLTQDNGTVKLILRKVTEFKFGQTDQNMKVFGQIIKRSGSEDLFWQMVMFTRAVG
jgi:hypothetical protein